MTSRLLYILIPVLALSLGLSITSGAQDYHFSNYQNNPVLFNPAKTGSFLGDIRLGGAYREQWRQFISNPFTTASLHGDFSLDLGLTEGDWISGGIQTYRDQSGDLTYQYFIGSLSVAYHLALGNKGESVLAIGLQFGRNQRELSLGNVKFGDELSGSTNASFDRNLLGNFNEINQDLGLGLEYRSTNRKGTQFVFGAAAQHINLSSGNNRVPFRVNVDAGVLTPINKQLWFTGEVYTSFMETASNLIILLGLPYKINIDSPFTFTPRLGMRIGDALVGGLGVDYNLWKFNVGYDVTISSASSYTGGRGALELGVQRIIYIYKKPKVNPTMLCPRL